MYEVNEMAKKNPFEMILDEKNNDNVIFYAEDGTKMEFEQVALIPIDDCKYVILHPVNMGYQDDEVIAYEFITDNNEYELIEVEDDDLLELIYKEFLKLIKKK